MEQYFETLLETRGALESCLVYLAARKPWRRTGRNYSSP